MQDDGCGRSEGNVCAAAAGTRYSCVTDRRKTPRPAARAVFRYAGDPHQNGFHTPAPPCPQRDSHPATSWQQTRQSLGPPASAAYELKTRLERPVLYLEVHRAYLPASNQD